MIADLVESARLSSGEITLTTTGINLRSFTEELCDRLETGKDSRIIVEAEPVGLVLADPNRLDRIFTNLLTNALKYSEPPSPVRIIIRENADENDARMAVVSVIDRGCGIAQVELPKLFERYARITSGKRSGDSLGLGLFIARKLVLAHGGQISVTSEQRVGSTFTFTLPLAK